MLHLEGKGLCTSKAVSGVLAGPAGRFVVSQFVGLIGPERLPRICRPRWPKHRDVAGVAQTCPSPVAEGDCKTCGSSRKSRAAGLGRFACPCGLRDRDGDWHV